MGRLNGVDVSYLLGELRGEFKAIRYEVRDLKQGMADLRRDVAAVKENQRPRRRISIPPWTIVRFVAAALFTLSAILVRMDLGVLKTVLSLAK
jgi:hypothetical protein